ncbi:hypothetical protein [Paenibacillus sp. FSL H8-0259]|uniref:hypothetical protein n=1 Tax=Paenibacillus sp. FSL H8-0259 TaxID=1920423 RepID=UPI0015C37A24|nr:hypothetical protein [Paenibacillus sp. FSL H8-0259]
MKSSALILLFISSFWRHLAAFLAELVGFIPLISAYSPLSAELEGFIPLISGYSLLSAELVGFIPLGQVLPSVGNGSAPISKEKYLGHYARYIHSRRIS